MVSNNSITNVTFYDIHTDYCAIDIETNQKGEIIEIAAIKVHNGAEIGRLSSLIKPKTDIDRSSTPFKINRIGNSELQDAPCIEEFLPKFIDFVKGYYILEHSGQNLFDIPKIRKAAEAIGIEFNPCYFNTCELAQAILRKPDDVENHTVETLGRFFGIREKEMHRAEPDAEDAHKIYQALINRLQKLDMDITSLKSMHCKLQHSNTNNNIHNVTKENDVLKRSSSVEKTPQISETVEKCLSSNMNPDLQGKTYYLTGNFAGGRKEDIKKRIDQYGFSLVCEKSIRKKPPTDFLIVGLCGSNSRNDEKIEDARNNGTSVYMEDTFFEILERKQHGTDDFTV